MTKPTPEVSSPVVKPPLVLIHGFRGSPLGLEAIAQDLRSAGYEVYTPAIPPFAGAEALKDYRPEAYAQYLAHYIRAHQLERPILIGHSMGSVISIAIAKYYPELIHKKIVLLSPIAGKTPRPFALISPLSALLPRTIVDYITTKFLFVPHDKQLLRATLDITHHCTADQPPKTSDAMRSAKFATKYCINDFLPLNNKKIFLLAGETDRLVKSAKTEKLGKKLQAKVEFLPKTGHLHNYEQPHETAAAILQFINT